MKPVESKYILRSNLMTILIIAIICLSATVSLISGAGGEYDAGYFMYVLVFFFILFLSLYVSRKTKIVLTRETFRFDGVFSSFFASWQSIWWLNMTYELPRLQRYSFITGRRGNLKFELNVNGKTKNIQISNISPKAQSIFSSIIHSHK